MTTLLQAVCQQTLKLSEIVDRSNTQCFPLHHISHARSLGRLDHDLDEPKEEDTLASVKENLDFAVLSIVYVQL